MIAVTVCPECQGTGMRDSGGEHPWGEPILISCDCSADPVQVDADYPCRSDGRCQYAIDHGAEGLGHCPKGKCQQPKINPEDEL